MLQWIINFVIFLVDISRWDCIRFLVFEIQLFNFSFNILPRGFLLKGANGGCVVLNFESHIYLHKFIYGDICTALNNWAFTVNKITFIDTNTSLKLIVNLINNLFMSLTQLVQVSLSNLLLSKFLGCDVVAGKKCPLESFLRLLYLCIWLANPACKL